MHTSCKKKCEWNIGGLNGHWFWNKNDGEIVFKLWGPFSIYQLIIKANPALFEWNWDGLVVLIHLPQDLKTILMALLFTNIFMSKPVTIDPPYFSCIIFRLVCMSYREISLFGIFWARIRCAPWSSSCSSRFVSIPSVPIGIVRAIQATSTWLSDKLIRISRNKETWS